MARVHESKLEGLLDSLDKLGVGSDFGIVEVVPLAVAMPLYVVTETRKEKLKQEQTKKAAESSSTKLESLFDDPSNSQSKPTISEEIFVSETNLVRKSLLGAWESFKENCAPPPQPILTSPRRKKENSKNTNVKPKSPRRKIHKHTSPRKDRDKEEREKVKEKDIEKEKPKHHRVHHTHSHQVHSRHRADSKHKKDSNLKVTTLWDEYLKDENGEGEDKSNRLLWGPKKSGHSKARSVDFGSNFKHAIDFTSNSCESIDDKEKALSDKMRDSNNNNSNNKVKNDKKIDSTPNIIITIPEENKLSGISFDIEEDDDENAVVFGVDSDIEEDEEEDVHFSVEVVDKNSFDRKSDDGILFCVDTDDEGDEDVFKMDDQGAIIGDDGDITFEISNSPRIQEKKNDEDNVKLLKKSKNTSQILKSPKATEFSLTANDSNDSDDVNFVIDLSDDGEDLHKLASSSTPVLRANPTLRMCSQETTTSSKIHRINSLTSEENRKIQLDSVATVQELFQTKPQEVTEEPKPSPKVPAHSNKRAVSTIIAEKFIVRDKSGKERACFGIDANDSVSITLKDTSSKRNITISIPNSSEPNNEMGMHFIIDGKRRLSHHITEDDEVETSMYGPDNESYSKMKVQKTNSPELSLGIKDQTLINLRGTQDIAELNPSDALVSLRSDPGFSGLSICDTLGATRATLGWYDLKKLLRLEKETDLVMIQMSGREASQDLDNFPEATLSVVGNVAKFYAKDQNGGIAELPPKTNEDDVSVVVNIEKAGAQLGLVKDGRLRTLGSSKTQQLLNAYGFAL